MSQIITGAPLWVWPLLAFLIWLGVRNLSERTSPVWTIAILPLVGLALAPLRLLAAPSLPIALAIFILCAAIALVVGWRVVRGIPARFDRADGRVTLPGSSFTLILSLSIFLVFYGFGVAFSIKPTLASDPSISLLLPAFGGLIVGFMLGRQGLLFVRYLQS